MLPDDARLDVPAEQPSAPDEPVAAEEPAWPSADVEDGDELDCGPDDLAGPLDEPEAEATPEPEPEPEAAPEAGAGTDMLAVDEADEADPAEVDAAEVDAAESLAAVEDVRGAETEPSGGAESDDAAHVADAVAEPVDAEAEPVYAGPDAPVGEDEDVAEIAVVEDLAEALGLDGPVAPVFDLDGPDDSGEAAVAYAGSKLATPPPGLAEADLVPTLEAILLVVDEPVSELTLAEVLEVPAELIAGTLIDLSAQYTRESRGFDLRRAAGGWRLYTRAEYAPYVERFVLDGQQLRLTQASLETLAVVAYKQPVTRSRISAIRGVNCDGVIRTLVTRGMIEECGTEPESGAYLYRTTSLFLEKLGLDSVDQLPPLAPFLPDNVEEIADEQR
ncbi:SMC-Scp complex subunit ScpB [Catellatospora citrea]|uniref:SMC-Scp complex subunit ScpB n=1 Tax=Catellatospora citrea TaxID=53366 RepID=UPI003570EF71